MRKSIQIILFLAIFTAICAYTPQSDEEFDVVKIGDLYWTSTNCIVDEFANGEEIPQAKTYTEWKTANENKMPVWCYYQYSKSNAEYGKIYNFHALVDKRSLAPKGYRLPHRKDWEHLMKALGGAKKASLHIKSKHGWKFEKNGNNSTGFNCQPFGFYQTRSADHMDIDNFNGEGLRTEFWAIRLKSNQAYGNLMQVHSLNKMNFDTDSRGAGAYIRLIKL